MIRRELREWLPALAHYCHVMPWDIDPDPPVLTTAELRVFLDFVPKADD